MPRPQPTRPATSPRLLLATGAFVALAASAIACEPTAAPPAQPAADPALAGLLADGEDEDGALPCPGASEAERAAAYHPKILRGEVLRPSGSEDEEGVKGASVSVRTIGDDYEVSGEAVVSTTTDPSGRYCVRLPDGLDFGPGLAVIATAGDLRLRRLAIDPDSGRISARSEAIVEVLSDAGIPPGAASYEELVNLHTVAATAVDLMASDEATSAEQAIAADPRVRALLEQMRR